MSEKMNEKKDALKFKHFLFIIIFAIATFFIIEHLVTKNDYEDKDMTTAFLKKNEKSLEKIKEISVTKNSRIMKIEVKSKFEDLESEINNDSIVKFKNEHMNNACEQYLDFKLKENSLIMDINNVKKYGKEKVYLDINKCFNFIITIVNLAEEEKNRQNNNINEIFKEPSNEK